MQADPLKKTLILGKIEGKGRRQRKRRLDSITDSMNTNLSKLQETMEERGVWGAVVHGVTKRPDLATEKQEQRKAIGTATSRVEAQAGLSSSAHIFLLSLHYGHLPNSLHHSQPGTHSCACSVLVAEICRPWHLS